MGFLDSSSSVVTAILTRKGRELLAKNDGSFRITKFAFGDDEINYQLYNSATDYDGDILNLPILEPSSNEITALRYRLVTAPIGAIQVAYLIAAPPRIVLQNSNVSNPRFPTNATISIQTRGGTDTQYIVRSRSTDIAQVPTGVVDAQQFENISVALIQISAGRSNGTTFIDVTGRDTGALISIPVTISSFTTSEL